LTKPELGVKRDCPSCGARFYDLTKVPAHCPKCHHEFTPEALLKPRKRREDEAAEEPAAKPAAETSLDQADKEAKAAKSKRKPGLDDEGGEAVADEEIDIEDLEVEVEDDEDDTLLEDDEDDDDEVSDIVGGGGGEET
jgi:uncharacterized protein (TIGR02300 family)